VLRAGLDARPAEPRDVLRAGRAGAESVTRIGPHAPGTLLSPSWVGGTVPAGPGLDNGSPIASMAANAVAEP
jgi:hypothetical protein